MVISKRVARGQNYTERFHARRLAEQARQLERCQSPARSMLMAQRLHQFNPDKYSEHGAFRRRCLEAALSAKTSRENSLTGGHERLMPSRSSQPAASTTSRHTLNPYSLLSSPDIISAPNSPSIYTVKLPPAAKATPAFEKETETKLPGSKPFTRKDFAGVEYSTVAPFELCFRPKKGISKFEYPISERVPGAVIRELPVVRQTDSSSSTLESCQDEISLASSRTSHSQGTQTPVSAVSGDLPTFRVLPSLSLNPLRGRQHLNVLISWSARLSEMADNIIMDLECVADEHKRNHLRSQQRKARDFTCSIQ